MKSDHNRPLRCRKQSGEIRFNNQKTKDLASSLFVFSLVVFFIANSILPIKLRATALMISGILFAIATYIAIAAAFHAFKFKKPARVRKASSTNLQDWKSVRSRKDSMRSVLVCLSESQVTFPKGGLEGRETRSSMFTGLKYLENMDSEKQVIHM